MTRTTKRFLALAVSVMMVVALLPLAVFAAEPQPMNVTVSKLMTVNQSDGNTEKSEANQAAVTVTPDGTISGILANLNIFPSTNGAQGSAKWVGLVINTGVEDITSVKYNGANLTSADVTEAESVGVGAGSFVLWVKAEALPKVFTLETEGSVLTTITVKFVDTTPPTPPQVVQPTTPQTVPAVGTPGVAVAGNLSAGASVTATETSLTTVAPAAGAQFTVALASGEKTLLSITEVKLTGTFNGKLSVTLPVDAQYNGQTVTVLHYTSAGRLETYTAVVVNGAVTVEVASLSPFAVLIDTKLVGEEGADLEEGTPEDELPDEDDTDIDEIPDDDGDDIVDEGEEPAKTGDFAAGSALVIAAIIATAAALAFVSKKARNN